MGEGGGQIVRTCVALSMVTGTPVTITNIRPNRPKPGLRPQHVAGIRAVADLCNGAVAGLKEGSRSIVFEPRKSRRGVLSVEVGTAGSISLVLQSLMLAALASPRDLQVSVTGGTDVKWSPPIDYVKNITLPFLGAMGYQGTVSVNTRGYYPRGGGWAEFHFRPSTLSPMKCVESLPPRTVGGISYCTGLPRKVAQRQATACSAALEEHGLGPVTIQEEATTGHKGCTGSGICVWSDTGYVAGSELGAPGKPAERVGQEAADDLLSNLSKDLPIDPHLSDQIVPFIALAPGSRVRVHDTSHVRTNMAVVRMFLGDVLEVKDMGEHVLELRSRGSAM